MFQHEKFWTNLSIVSAMNKRILFLSAEIMGYTAATLSCLVSKGYDLTVIHWSKGKLTNYLLEPNERITYLDRETTSALEIIKLINDLKIHAIVVAGWQDRRYLIPCLYFRYKLGIVVTCFDDQWFGKPKQIVAEVLGRLRLFKAFFSASWVSGPCQYEYARRLGFKKEEIAFDLLSADSTKFTVKKRQEFQVVNNSSDLKYFTFVGRLEFVKGVDLLIDAWSELESHGNWRLRLIGDGSYSELIKGKRNVEHIPFLQPDQLVQFFGNSHCFVLPSRFEPWGVVVHEATLLGLPLILSNEVGARSTFCIDNYNGFLFKSGSKEGLKQAFVKIMNLEFEELNCFSKRSFLLSERISPESSSSNLISLLL